MTRPLEAAELDCATALARFGYAYGTPPSVTQRMDWVRFLDTALAGATCGCGRCPSIDLTDEQGRVPTGAASHVLRGGTDDLLLLLHVVDGRPSYLECSPLRGEAVLEFPAASALSFGR